MVTFNETKQDHPATRMLGKIQRSMRLIQRVMKRREKYAEVLSLRYHDNDAALNQANIQSGEDFRRHGENYSYRFMRYLMSQVSGEPLHIRADRNAGSGQVEEGVPGDATTGSWVDEVMKRAAFEGQLEHELSKLAQACCAYGCGAMSLGYMDGAQRREALLEAAKDHNEILEEVVRKGDTQAKPGQDHERVQFHLRDAALQPTWTEEQRAAILKRAQSHDALMTLEQKRAKMKRTDDPDARAEDWRLADQNVWGQFRHVGLDVVFDMTRHDVRHTSWRAERVMVPLSKFVKDDTYTQAARSKAEGLGKRNKSMMADDSHPQSTVTEQQKDIYGEELVETWRVYIRRPDMRSGGVRRIVSPELPGMWIHASEDYPYVIDDKHEVDLGDGTTITLDGPEHGKPAFSGWWPIEVYAPLKSPIPVPESMLGIPLIAPGWAQQIELNQLAAIDYSKAKRAIRQWLGDRAAFASESERKAVENAARAGIDGTFHWVNVAPGKDLDTAVTALDFRSTAPEITEQRAITLQKWSHVQSFPQALLQLAGTGATLGQDEMGITQGDQEMGLILAEFERAAAYTIRSWAGLIREFYSDEKLRRMLGQKGAEAILTWKHSALDGDRYVVRLGPRARAEDRVDRKQLMEAIQLIREVFVDDIGAPLYDLKPLAEELLRSMKLGTLEPLKNFHEDPRYAQVMQMLDAMAKVLQEHENKLGGGQDNKLGSPNAQPGPEAQLTPSGQAPETGTLSAGASRDTMKV